MSTILHRTVAALGFLAVVGAGSARAQQLPDAAPAVAASTAAQAVGRWLYDAQGNTIGSIRVLADDVLVDGKVTLQSKTVEAMNTLAH